MNVGFFIFVAAISLAVASQEPADDWEGFVPCPDETLQVLASEEGVAEQICREAEDAKPAIAICGLVQSETILIETVDVIESGTGPSLASFDARRNLISVTPPDLLREKLKPGDAYAVLSDNTIFRSLIVHEMAHALLDQTLAGRQVSLIDHEYTANALEIATLAPEDREAILAAVGAPPHATVERINGFIYMMEPRTFAAFSWYYHAQAGCAAIEGILDGTFTFQHTRL